MFYLFFSHIPFTSKPPRNLSHPFNRIFSPSTAKNSSNLSLPFSVVQNAEYERNKIFFAVFCFNVRNKNVGINYYVPYRYLTFHRHISDQISCKPLRIWNLRNLLAPLVVTDPFVCRRRRALLVFWLYPLTKNGIVVALRWAFDLVCMARLFFGLPRKLIDWLLLIGVNYP